MPRKIQGQDVHRPVEPAKLMEKGLTAAPGPVKQDQGGAVRGNSLFSGFIADIRRQADAVHDYLSAMGKQILYAMLAWMQLNQKSDIRDKVESLK